MTTFRERVEALPTWTPEQIADYLREAGGRPVFLLRDAVLALCEDEPAEGRTPRDEAVALLLEMCGVVVVSELPDDVMASYLARLKSTAAALSAPAEAEYGATCLFCGEPGVPMCLFCGEPGVPHPLARRPTTKEGE